MSWRVAVAGMHIESGTFTPLRSRREDFFTLRGDEMLSRYPFLVDAEFSAMEMQPLVHFRAMPGGMIAAQDYAAMKREIIDRLCALHDAPDAFFFDVHGAMTVEGLDDAEADLLEEIRRHLPGGALVTCSQDLHGNVSPRLLSSLDLITTYRTAPHVDWMETRERALRLLMRALREGKCPALAYVAIPVLVSGEMSSTEYEPGRSLYAPIAGEASQAGIWDVSLWVGYAWADQARAGAMAIALADDADCAKGMAEQIAQRYWDARHRMTFVSPAASFAEAWEQVCAFEDKAFFLSDAGDNPTAGAAGDVTDTLARLLEANAGLVEKKQAIFASIPDSRACEIMHAAGVGAQVAVELGGKLDPLHGKVLPLMGEVRALISGDDAQAMLRVEGVDIIVSVRRRPYHRRDDFLALGLDPLRADLTVVKIGYLEPELKAMARRHLLLLSPGGVRADFWNLPYEHRQRPLYPFEKHFDWQPVAVCK
jgi:microcystin degradation protein MlrC